MCFFFHSQEQYSPDCASGYISSFFAVLQHLNITTAVIDAENTVVVSNQGAKSGAVAVDFVIPALAKGAGRQKILTNTLAISKSGVSVHPSMVLQDFWRRGRAGGRLFGGAV